MYFTKLENLFQPDNHDYFKKMWGQCYGNFSLYSLISWIFLMISLWNFLKIPGNIYVKKAIKKFLTKVIPRTCIIQ